MSTKVYIVMRKQDTRTNEYMGGRKGKRLICTFTWRYILLIVDMKYAKRDVDQYSSHNT